MCQKISYETKAEALQDAKLIRTQHKFLKDGSDISKRYRPYLCRYCGKWHLTTKAQLRHLKRRSRNASS